MTVRWGHIIPLCWWNHSITLSPSSLECHLRRINEIDFNKNIMRECCCRKSLSSVHETCSKSSSKIRINTIPQVYTDVQSFDTGQVRTPLCYCCRTTWWRYYRLFFCDGTEMKLWWKPSPCCRVLSLASVCIRAIFHLRPLRRQATEIKHLSPKSNTHTKPVCLSLWSFCWLSYCT